MMLMVPPGLSPSSSQFSNRGSTGSLNRDGQNFSTPPSVLSIDIAPFSLSRFDYPGEFRFENWKKNWQYSEHQGCSGINCDEPAYDPGKDTDDRLNEDFRGDALWASVSPGTAPFYPGGAGNGTVLDWGSNTQPRVFKSVALAYKLSYRGW